MADTVAIAAAFETFLTELTPAELAALGAGVLLTGGLIAGADGKVSMRETLALGHSLLDGKRALGPAFTAKLIPAAHHAIEAVDVEMVQARQRLQQAQADRKAGKPLDADTEAWLEAVSQPMGLVVPHFERARAVRARMPEPVQVAFDDHIAHLLVRVAEASGRLLWWGEQINEDERQVARDLIGRFGVEIRDPEIRQKFKLG
jgi:hypothetical protein